MEFNGSCSQSGSQSPKPPLQAFKLLNVGHTPLSMALLQLSDRHLLQPLIR
jgi:hypothetical protein